MTLNSQCAFRAASQSQLGNGACEPLWTVLLEFTATVNPKKQLTAGAYVLSPPTFGGVR
jgi:hypothetical protein